MADKKPSPIHASFVGKTVYLRPLTSDDVANTQAWRLQNGAQTISARPVLFWSPTDAAERYKKNEKEIGHQRFAVVRSKDKMLVGMVTFFDFNPLNRSAELGVMIDPDEQKNGYAKEAVRLLAGFLFKSWGLNKVHAQTAAFNKAAVALLESLGFKKDGTLREHYFHESEYYDGYIYSLMAYEYEK